MADQKVDPMAAQKVGRWAGMWVDQKAVLSVDLSVDLLVASKVGPWAARLVVQRVAPTVVWLVGRSAGQSVVL
jgi:hypothetical protein